MQSQLGTIIDKDRYIKGFGTYGLPREYMFHVDVDDIQTTPNNQPKGKTYEPSSLYSKLCTRAVRLWSGILRAVRHDNR